MRFHEIWYSKWITTIFLVISRNYCYHQIGDAGLLGVTFPTEYGGQGLDFKFNIAFNEALGYINCGGVPMSIAVQTDMTTPALARFGSDELKEQFLKPSIAGDVVSCLGVSEPGGGSDVAR